MKVTVSFDFPDTQSARDTLSRLIPLAESVIVDGQVTKCRDFEPKPAKKRGRPAKNAASQPEIAVDEAGTVLRSEAYAHGSVPPPVADVHAALNKMAATKGLGTGAVIQHLRDFGVMRISELKPKQYGLVIKQALEKVAEAK